MKTSINDILREEKYPLPKRDGIDVIKLLFYAAMFTISFDLFFNINIGVNIRGSQLFLIAFMLIGTIKLLHGQKIITPLGLAPLIVWWLFNLVFIPVSEWKGRPVGYHLFLTFNILVILFTVQHFSSLGRIYLLSRMYVFSFVFVALFGIFQFTLYLINIDPPFISQWWVGGIPRISGFSYEPSYYGSYLIIGWVFVLTLIENNSQLLSRRQQLSIFIILSIAIVLSSSRMTLLVMFLFLFKYLLLLLSGINTTTIGSRVFAWSVILFLVSLVSFALLITFSSQAVHFLNGLGLAGLPSHSSSSRVTIMLDTLNLFIDSPLIGYSLGGVAVAIGAKRGAVVDSFAVAKNNEGMSVFVEVLAATGLIGFIFFITYIFTLIFKPYRFYIKYKDSQYGILLKAFVISLVAELLILQMNQNILRPPLWLHIAILSAVYATCIRQPGWQQDVSK